MMLVKYEENIDILNLIMDYIIGTLDYNKNIFNKVIREIEIKNYVFEGNNKACGDQLLEELIKYESINTEVTLQIVNNSCFSTFTPFFLKYFNKPHVYLLESTKRKELSLWS